MRTVAVVPVKEKSDRVTSKNFREFHDGISLFEHKIRQLRTSGCFDAIYVSSDYEALKERQAELGFIFLKRDPDYCTNVMPWSDVIHYVASSLPENPGTSLAWCHTTSPLFNDYSACLRNYHEKVAEGEHDGLVSVKRVAEFLISEGGLPINYGWGVWHRYSQHLPKVYAVNGALFVAKIGTMIENRYVISRQPYFHEADDLSSVDVDTELDFSYAQYLMEQHQK